ncbi:hypothetical protein AAMO2058_000798800 [Amorphochlora amoebiformis]
MGPFLGLVASVLTLFPALCLAANVHVDANGHLNATTGTGSGSLARVRASVGVNRTKYDAPTNGWILPKPFEGDYSKPTSDSFLSDEIGAPTDGFFNRFVFDARDRNARRILNSGLPRGFHEVYQQHRPGSLYAQVSAHNLQDQNLKMRAAMT